MTAVSAPFGLRPSQHLSALIVRPEFLNQTKALMEATPTLFQNQPCILDASGRLAAAVAGAGNTVLGSFQGVEYVDLATGRPVVSNNWQNGTTVKDLGTASARVWFTRDPYIVYDIQANAPVAQSSPGEEGSFTGTSGNTTTGFSTAGYDVSTQASAADQFKVWNLFLDPANDWGDAFTIIQVVISQPQEFPALTGV